MKECKQFKELYETISKYSANASKPFDCFACGNVFEFPWRLFQEKTNDGYTAWLGIKDENAGSSKWPAFYTKSDIEEWVKIREQ